MKKHLILTALIGILFSCYQAPQQWTENKDERLYNTRWFNADSSDVWEFDTVSGGNKRFKDEIVATFQAFSVDMQWEAFKKCSLVVHATYYLRDNPSMPNYYHRSFQYSLSDSTDSILVVNAEKYFFAGMLHN